MSKSATAAPDDDHGQEMTISEPRGHMEVTAPPKIGIFDPQLFLHMHRIAEIMADNSLIPDGLCKIKKGNDLIDLPRPTVVSNCFLVTNQAYRWGMDPFAVAQCCSVVHGRLMYEGKLVSAAIDANLGLNLSYQFGTWDGKKVDVAAGEGEGDKLGVIVTAFDPKTGEIISDPVTGLPQTVDGSVGDWKTTGTNTPWGGHYKNKRQLRYRGAREWARAHRSATMLGVVPEDEIDDAIDQARLARAVPVGTGGIARLQIHEKAGGFNAAAAREAISEAETVTGEDTKKAATAAATAKPSTEKQAVEKKEEPAATITLPDGGKEAFIQSILSKLSPSDRDIMVEELLKKKPAEPDPNQITMDLGDNAAAKAKTETKAEVVEDGDRGPGLSAKFLSDYSKALKRCRTEKSLPEVSKEFMQGKPAPVKGKLAYDEMVAVYNLHLDRVRGKIDELGFSHDISEIIGNADHSEDGKEPAA